MKSLNWQYLTVRLHEVDKSEISCARAEIVKTDTMDEMWEYMKRRGLYDFLVRGLYGEVLHRRDRQSRGN